MESDRPVRVLVDGWHSNASRTRGIGVYLHHVLTHLAADPSLEVAALVLDEDDVPAGIEPFRMRRFTPGRFHRREHELMFPLDVARRRHQWRPDVLWCPGPEAPWRTSVPFVQTLHDVTAIVFDHPGLAEERSQLRRMAPRYRRAAALVANSAYTADSTARVLELDRDLITVTHLGVDPVFQPSDADRCHDPYVLFVGVFGPHKGYAEACAVADAIAAAGHPHRLKIVGLLTPWNEEEIRALRAGARHPERIELAGFVEDLAATMQRATALIMTSRHEGFGLPLVEAMACATPVVGFDNSCIPEVIGDGGTVVADGDAAALAAALAPILTRGDAWQEASTRALARSRHFDWAVTARLHGEVFRSVAQRTGRP